MENWIEVELKFDNLKNSIENGRGVFINSKFQQIKSMKKKKFNSLKFLYCIPNCHWPMWIVKFYSSIENHN
jgi:hypothetical protein